MTHPSRQRSARDGLVAELVDAVESRDVAWSVYLAAGEYTDAEDRARAHLSNCVNAVAAAELRLFRFDRGMPAPARWAGS